MERKQRVEKGNGVIRMQFRHLQKIVQFNWTFIIFLIFISQSNLAAQYGQIAGSVYERYTNKPLKDVNVFLAYTTKGAMSDVKGAFHLEHIPYGNYELVFSHIGYETKIVSVHINSPDIQSIHVKLNESVLQGERVQVEAKEDDAWQRDFSHFVKIFIGDSENAEECRILNPYSLEFDHSENNHFFAKTDVPLQIINEALGYTITVLLTEFEWASDGGMYVYYPYFEEIPSNDEELILHWIENREETYYGSLRHFLVELIDNGLKDNWPFDVYPAKIIGGRIIYDRKRLNYKSELDLTLQDSTLMIYRLQVPTGVIAIRNKDEQEQSFLHLLEGYLDIDALGTLYNARDHRVSGDWSKYRLADILPNDFQIEQLKEKK